MNEISENNRESLPIPIKSREIAEHKGVKCANCGKVFNREKIFCPVCGLRCTEDAKLPAETVFVQPGLEQATRSSRVFSLLSFILGIAGPLALGIGWLLAIIFGFTSLNVIKTRGGFSRDRKLALWGIALGFIWPVAIGFFALFFSYRSMTNRRIQGNEADIMNELKNIAITQKYVKSGCFFDEDNDEESEYANFTNLSRVDYLYFDPGITSGEKYGYSIQMEVLKERGFRIIAHPLSHRTTGNRSFYVDESGFLRAGDIAGEHSFRDWQKLSKVESDSVFAEFDDEIAGDLLNLSRKLAAERDFARARKILTEIKNNYYLSPASSEVTSVIESINAYIAEDSARENYRRALKLMKNGEYRLALTVLKDVERNYQDTMTIPDVQRDISEVKKILADTLEQEAKQLFASAENLELQGKYEDALAKYRKIVKELDSTSYSARAGKLIPTIEKKLQEKKAESIFTDLLKLKCEEKYAKVIQATGVLMDHYADTDLLKKKKDYISLLKATAIGYREKNRARQEFQKQNFQAAIQAGEEALRANSELAKDIKPVLQTSYIKLAEHHFKNKVYAKAVPYYEKWLKLSPQKSAAERKHYTESRYHVAKSDYLSGKYDEAKKNLLALRYQLAQRDELWYLLGSILIIEKNYGNALNYFKSAISRNDKNFGAWYKASLCQLALIQKLEEELSSQLKQFDSLKCGVDIVTEATSIINALHAKHIELRLQAGPKLLQGKTQLTPDQIKKKKLAPVERAKFLAATRAKNYALVSRHQQNQIARDRVVSTMRRICDKLSTTQLNLTSSAVLSDANPELSRLRTLVRKKARYFSLSHAELGAGLSRQQHFEEKTVRCLASTLSSFGKVQSISDYADQIDSLHEPLGRTQMSKKISKGREFLQGAMSIKISVEDYLTGIEE